MKMMKIKTPLGTLKVEAKGAESDYPGIYIILEETDQLLTVVEYDDVSEHIQTVVYCNDCEDEPVCIVKHIMKEVD